MRLEDLFNECQIGTTIQKQAHLKKFINAEIIIEGTIVDIKPDGVYITSSWKDPIDIDQSIRVKNTIGYKEAFANTLLNYSNDDIVKVSAQLTKIVIEDYNCLYWFNLSSIEKISTIEEERRLEEESRERWYEELAMSIKKQEKKIDRQVFLPAFLISVPVIVYSFEKTIHSDGYLFTGFIMPITLFIFIAIAFYSACKIF